MIMQGAKKRVHDILGPVEPSPKEGDGSDVLEAIADELIEAVKMGDAKSVATALKAAFAHCEAEPHEEGSHTNE